MNLSRIETLRSKLERFNIQGAVAIPGPTLRYLTDREFHLMERPVFLIVTIDQDPVMVLPELESTRVDDAGGRIQIFSYAEDDASRLTALKNAVDLIGSSALTLAVEPLSMRYFELELLRSAAPDWEFQSGTELFTVLRAKKDEAEIKHIRKAVEIAETALQETLPLIKVGMSEHDLAAELVIQLLRANSETALPFQPIVASGPNSALPHATPTDRLLAPGDLLILDWGARSGGYISDITRTFAIGEVEPEFKRFHQVVLEANTAGRSAVKPGTSCDAIDQATRQVIIDAGYGERFIHRTGHGIGLEAHEPPNIRSGELVPLEAGMTFTVEPGIYLPGRAGVRIEDNVLVTENGFGTLTTLERTLEVVG
jgi:Xaa-Pro dipeptidase